MILSIIGVKIIFGYLVKKEGIVLGIIWKDYECWEDMRKGKISINRSNLEIKRIIILIVIIGKKGIFIGIERLVIEIFIGRGMNRKIN